MTAWWISFLAISGISWLLNPLVPGSKLAPLYLGLTLVSATVGATVITQMGIL